MSPPQTAPAAMQSARSSRIYILLACLLALVPVVFQLYVTLHHLKSGWDDAAITAAFARTWAESGRIALTPVSQTVEGWSSLLWFLLLSIPFFFTHNPDAGLVWMKVLSAIFLLLSLPLIYWIALRQFASRAAAIVSMLMLAFCFTSHQEIQSGMEMNLAVFLMLLLFHFLTREDTQHRVLYASITTCLLLLTRFEIPFMLGLLFCGFLFAAWRGHPGAVPVGDLLKIFFITITFFALTEVWRYHVFGEWMPNTIYAKAHIPYRDWSTLKKFVETRLFAINEPIRILRFPMLIAAAAWAYGLYRKQLSSGWTQRVHPAVWLLAAGCFLFGAFFGRNWGHPGRMIAEMMPFLILACVGVCVSALPSRRMLTMFLAVMLAAHLLVWLRHAIEPFGIVRMTEIEPIGLGADAVRAALHQDKLVVMISDVGASALCCERLDIVDSGLLTNPTLARTGWKNFPAYFRQVDPDLVETHYFWATDADIYNQHLLDNYSIVASDGVRFFLRNDLYQQLLAEHAGPVLPVAMVPACMPPQPEDDAYSLSKQTCLVLNSPDAQNNPT